MASAYSPLWAQLKSGASLELHVTQDCVDEVKKGFINCKHRDAKHRADFPEARLDFLHIEEKNILHVTLFTGEGL